MSAFLTKLIGIFTSLIICFQSSFAVVDLNPKTDDFTQCKNVIFMIGDGMGFNSIEKTKYEENIDTINMDKIPVHGESKTQSANSPITDSAAGGTALATATRVDNDSLGVYPYDKNALYSFPMNLTELAISQGKLAGVVTTDSTSGATPASFSAHTSDRGNEEDITLQQLAGDLTLIWGTKSATCTPELCAENDYEYIYNETTMDALTEGTRSFGQFGQALWHQESPQGMPTLAEMTSKAIDLLDNDEDGFFLMVEGAHIDKKSHDNDGEGMKDALLSFDAAIGVALEYAKTHGDTLVVVTADHETGGIMKIGKGYKYTRGGHSGYNVPLFVYGCDNFVENGKAIKNKEVSRRVSCVMGCDDFPVRVFTAEEAAENN